MVSDVSNVTGQDGGARVARLSIRLSSSAGCRSMHRDEERRRGPTAPTREGLDGRVGHAGPCVLWLALL